MPITRTGIPDFSYVRHSGSIWIDNNRDSLPDELWIAANDAGEVATDDTIDGLLQKVRAQNIELHEVAIAYITSESS